ncbi:MULTISPECIES: inositol 2-dehydrogenase [Rhodomicrobium]|uniref:inositol 2-dehydrogenase n=1 Tax=Rhodomicrobium TaxID=1068 RepID=UPI000B4B3E91|nr:MULTISPECIES: inositol 2-dehydrogenase [Rhodomicrobium]
MKQGLIRFAVLGVGRIGSIHARNIARQPGARLAMVSDVDEAAANAIAAELGATAAGLDEAIASAEIDAVVICTPTDTHADLIDRAAAAGKAIFCEKPIDLDSARIRRSLDGVAARGVPLMIGFNRRFDPSFQTLQARVRAGEIGAVEIVTILSRDPAPPPVSYIKRSGGLFRDMMIHDLDMARFLLGEEPVSVYAAASALVDPAIGAAGDVDTAVCVLRTDSGRIAQISNSRRAAYGYDQRIEVHGALGLLAAGNRTATTVTAAGASGFTTDPALPFFLERYADAYRAEIASFVEALRNSTAPSPSGEDGLKAQILADAATESARLGVPVVLPHS